jgi:hypothetical protein
MPFRESGSGNDMRAYPIEDYILIERVIARFG